MHTNTPSNAVHVADRKSARLRQLGLLNPHPERVIDEQFAHSEFFDPRDLLQVRYEMIRAVHLQGRTLAQAAARFGVSRPTCFRLSKAFRNSGLSGLIPAMRGPKGAHKITPEILEFVDRYRMTYGPTGARRLVPLIEQEFALQVHPRGLEKALQRRKKNAATNHNESER